MFEYVYFARPDSVLWGRNVHAVRKALGHQLAREYPVVADLVIAVPDSGVGAALGYAEESGLPYDMGLVRNHYVGRTFIEPQQGIRHFGVKVKLNPNREVLDGKRVVVIDDSIVRGTTSRKIVQDDPGRGRAGGAHAHLLAADPVALLLRHRHAHPAGADRVEPQGGGDPALSRRGLPRLPVARRHAQGHRASDPDHFCHACFTGQYQVGFESEELAQLKLFDS